MAAPLCLQARRGKSCKFARLQRRRQQLSLAPVRLRVCASFRLRPVLLAARRRAVCREVAILGAVSWTPLRQWQSAPAEKAHQPQPLTARMRSTHRDVQQQSGDMRRRVPPMRNVP